MECERSCFEGIDAQKDQISRLSPILKAAFGHFRTRYARYLSIQATDSVSEARTLRLSSAKLPKDSPKFMGNTRTSRNGSDGVQPFIEGAYALLPVNRQPTHLADALLHDDPRPGHAGPGFVWLDDQGTLSLAREIDGMVLCLKIFYVYQADPLWSVPLPVVADLKFWLNRQFLALQGITPMPKNPRAITTSDQVWKLLAQFDATTQHKSAFIRSTPVDSTPRIPIVEASVRSHVHSPHATLPNQGFDMAAEALQAKVPTNISYLDCPSAQTQANLTGGFNSYPLNADMSLQCQNQAQLAEIARLTHSIKEYGGRMRSAYRDIRYLRSELRDSQNQNRELQERYNLSRNKAAPGGGSGTQSELSFAPTKSYIAHHVLSFQGVATIQKAMTDPQAILLKALVNGLTTVSPDSIQQASDLSDDIVNAATRLVNTVEAHAIIQAGVTERTLWDLQVVLDVLEETAREIKDQPVPGYSENEVNDDGGVAGDEVDDQAVDDLEEGDGQEEADNNDEASDEDAASGKEQQGKA